MGVNLDIGDLLGNEEDEGDDQGNDSQTPSQQSTGGSVGVINRYGVELIKYNDELEQELSSFHYRLGEVRIQASSELVIPLERYNPEEFRDFISRCIEEETNYKLTRKETAPDHDRMRFQNDGQYQWFFRANEVGDATGQKWTSVTTFNPQTKQITISPRNQGCLGWGDFLAFVTSSIRFFEKVQTIP